MVPALSTSKQAVPLTRYLFLGIPTLSPRPQDDKQQAHCNLFHVRHNSNVTNSSPCHQTSVGGPEKGRFCRIDLRRLHYDVHKNA